MSPRVSVLMTTYNREKYVAFAIESVLASSYRDFELIIVDDVSSDDTVQIARQFEAIDDRVKVVVNNTNLGDYPNRNRAASLASGEFLKYVDADDYLYPHGLEVLVDMMSQFPNAGYGLCSLDQDSERPFPFGLSPREAYLRHYFGPSLFHKAPLSAIIRRSAWQEIGGFPEERMVGDFAMWHRMSTRHDVLLMPYGPVWYREHDEQEVSDIARDPIHYRIAYEQIVQAALKSPDCPLNSSECQQVLQRYDRSVRRTQVKSLLKMQLSDVKRLHQHRKGFRFA